MTRRSQQQFLRLFLSFVFIIFPSKRGNQTKNFLKNRGILNGSKCNFLPFFMNEPAFQLGQMVGYRRSPSNQNLSDLARRNLLIFLIFPAELDQLRLWFLIPNFDTS